MILTANRLAIVGAVFLATAICCALFLITDFIYGSTLAAGVTAGAGFLFATVWYAVPLARRMRG